MHQQDETERLKHQKEQEGKVVCDTKLETCPYVCTFYTKIDDT